MKQVKTFWRDLSIRIKLWSYFFIVIALVSLFNLYLNNNNYAIVDQFNQTMTGYYTINQLLNLTEENGQAINRYLRDRDLDDKDVYLKTQSDIKGITADLYQQYDSREIYFILTAIDNSSDVYFETWDLAIEERENQVDTYYNNYYSGETIQEYTLGYIQQLLTLSLEEGTSLYNELARQASFMRQLSFLLIGAAFVFALFIGALFANYLVRPIKKLSDLSMKMSAGELDVEAVEYEANDEVGVLGQSFNTMSASIRKYVEDLEQTAFIEKKLHEEELEVIRMEQLVREAKFHALQSQINPHFLFNTLNTISRTAMFEDADNTVGLIHSLSSLFRYKLKQDNEIIPLKEEINIINEYIHLQKVRFKERLEFIVDMDQLSLDVMIPIFIFQPVVENAIIHGIEPKVEGGKVRIKVRTSEKDGLMMTRVHITDTGVGMDQATLDRVKLYELTGHKSIGVGNVFNRFLLTYGEECAFDIQSKPGLGTCVKFKFQTEVSDERTI